MDAQTTSPSNSGEGEPAGPGGDGEGEPGGSPAGRPDDGSAGRPGAGSGGGPDDGPDGSDEEEEPGSGPEDKRYLRTLFAVYVLLLGTAFCVAAWAQRVEDDFATAVTALGAVLLLVPTMEVVAKRDARRDATRHRLVFLMAFGVAAAVAAVLWLALGASAVNVTDRVSPKGTTSLGPGSTVELAVDAEPGGHDELNVTFELQDEAAGATSCLPGSRLRFEGQDLARALTVATDDEVTAALPLDAPGPEVSVDITLIADEGCQVELVRKQASYR